MHAPAEVLEQFWYDVRKLLTHPSGYGHSGKDADAGIDAYRRDLLRRSRSAVIPEAVYNQGEGQTARVIDGLIKTKFSGLG